MNGVADKKRPSRERRREEEQKAKKKIWRKGCNQSVQAHGIPLALDVFIKGQGGDKASCPYPGQGLSVWDTITLISPRLPGLAESKVPTARQVDLR